MLVWISCLWNKKFRKSAYHVNLRNIYQEIYIWYCSLTVPYYISCLILSKAACVGYITHHFRFNGSGHHHGFGLLSVMAKFYAVGISAMVLTRKLSVLYFAKLNKPRNFTTNLIVWCKWKVRVWGAFSKEDVCVVWCTEIRTHRDYQGTIREICFCTRGSVCLAQGDEMQLGPRNDIIFKSLYSTAPLLLIWDWDVQKPETRKSNADTVINKKMVCC